MSVDQERQMQRLLEDINDSLLYEDEEQLNFFDLQTMLSDLGVLAASNIGRELLEDKVEIFTSLLSDTLGRHISTDQSREVLALSDASDN